MTNTTRNLIIELSKFKVAKIGLFVGKEILRRD
jgi:hypothetical protein